MEQIKRKRGISIVALVLALLLIGGVIIGFYAWREHDLNEVQRAALNELEENEGEYNENVIILQNTTQKRAEKLASKLGASLRITANGEFAALTLPEGVTVADVYGDRANRSALEEMSLDYHVYLASAEPTEEEEEETLFRPNYQVEESDYHLQTYLDYINIGDVWNSTLGATADGTKVKVAVIDTGIDTDHPEFFDAEGNTIISTKSYNASDDKIVEMYENDWSIIEDENGHGTAVAGVIAAQMNGVGITGIAPDVELIVIKCEYDEYGKTFKSSADLTFGIYYAIEQDVDVISMSFGGEGFTTGSVALRLAVESDIIPVASAGNDSTDKPQYPAASPYAIGVGALAQNSFELAEYSNYGINSDIVAPGATYTAAMGGGYTYMRGTSLATPIVSAAVALYVAQNKYVTFDTVKAEIEAAGKDLGDLGEDDDYGFGCLDVSAFILEEKGTITYDYGTEDIESTTQVFVRSHTIQTVPDPERDHVVFDDWYYDKAYTRVFDYDAYYTTEFVEDITLYAKWMNEDDEGTSVYTYTTLDDGSIEITGYRGKRRYLTIPDAIDGKTVSSIGANAFAYNTRLREIILPAGVVYIKESAFEGLTSLREITFTGTQLQEIGAKAFARDKALRSVSIPDSVVAIGSRAFEGCAALSTAEITESSMLTSIGEFAFSGTAITAFYVPQSANFDGSIVAYCTKLRQVKVHPDNTQYLVDDLTVYNANKSELVYHPATAKGDYTVVDSVTAIGKYAFAASSISSCTMPDTVLTLGKYAFASSALTSVTLSESITVIPEGAFMKSELRSVVIPAAVVKIANQAFQGSSLQTLLFAENSALALIADGSEKAKTGAFAGCEMLQSFSFPSALQYIGEYAFANCVSITELVIPKGVQVLGKAAFTKCTKLNCVEFEADGVLTEIPHNCFKDCVLLTSVRFPDAIVTLGSYCFQNCRSLSVLDFGTSNQLSTVAMYAFYSCSSLTSMQLPSSVVEIGDFAYAFSGLREAVIPAGLETLGKGAFGACYKLTTFAVAEGNTAFSAVDNVLFDADVTVVYCVPSARAGAYALPGTVRVIDQYAFYCDTRLTAITLPEGLEEIREYAFYQCSLLTSMDIPDAVFTIGRYGFAYCYSLSSVNFGEESVLQRLGYATFVSCGIRELAVPASVESMAQYVFLKCNQLSSLVFAANSKLTYISAYMFSGCNSLTSIVFKEGSSLTSLQARAFSGMSALKTIDFGDAPITNIDNYAFYECRNLQELPLPQAVTYIGRYAFYNCTQFTRIDVPASVEYIGANAFYTPTAHIRVFFATELLPAYIQTNWDNGIAGYFLNAKEYVITDLWEYAITFDDTVALALYKGTAAVLTVDTVDGMTVEKIGARTFYDNDVLTAVTIGDSVTEIGNYAFYGCDSLAALSVPASVQKIGDHAFAKSVTSVSLAAEGVLKSIGDYAFLENVTEHIVLPDSTVEIGEGAFQSSAVKTLTVGESSLLATIKRQAFADSALTAIYLPASMQQIGDGAFENTKSLATVTFAGGEAAMRIGNSAFNNTGIVEVTIPANVNYIGEYAFGSNAYLQNIYVDADNTAYTSLNGILCDIAGATLLQYPTGREGAFEVPAEITVLTYASFKDAVGLTEVTFAKGSIVKTIGWQTFSGCTALTKITVPDTVVSFDFYAFENCTALADVVLGENSALSGVYEGAFYNCTSLVNIALPAAVIEISDYAFYNCRSLTAIPLAEGAALKGIYAYAFYGCEQITQIPHFPQLREIGAYAFAGTSVVEYTLPKTVTSIDLTAFVDSKLEAIYVEEGGVSYTSIDGVLLEYGATSITETDAIVLWPHCKIYVLGEGKTTIELADTALIREGVVSNWVLAPTVVNISDRAFANCKELLNVEIPNHVITIGNYAFVGCSGLKSITISEGITSIGSHAFSSCTALTEINFNAVALDDVSDRVFAYAGRNSMGVTVNVGANVTQIPAHLFMCSTSSYYDDPSPNIINVMFAEESVCASIGFGAFKNCKNLASVMIPESVTNIGESAFEGCDNKLAIGFRGSELPTTLGAYWSGNAGYCLNAKEFIFEDEATYITVGNGQAYLVKYYGSAGNVAINSIIRDVEVVGIGANAFYQNVDLVNISIPSGIIDVGYNAFYACSNLVEVTIPTSVVTIRSGAFGECSNLIAVHIESLAQWCRISFDGAWANPLFYARHLIVCGNVISNLVIPDGVNEISAYAFAGFKGIESIVISTDVVSIGSGAFSSCDNLISVTIPESVAYIGSGAFSNCLSLEKIEYNAANVADLNEYDYVFSNAGQVGNGIQLIIGDSVTKIPAYLFSSFRTDNALNVVDLTIGKNVTSIGKSAFCGCARLESVSYNATAAEVSTMDVFCSVEDSEKSFKLKVGANVTKIPQGLFYHSNVSILEFEDESVCESIGYAAFADCTNLISITIPKTTTHLGQRAFANSAALEVILFNAENMEDLASDYDNAFYNAGKGGSGIKVVVGTSVVRIPSYFANAYSNNGNVCIVSVNFEEGSSCTDIGTKAFAACTTLQDIKMPARIKTIEADAFEGCTSLTVVHLEDLAKWCGVSLAGETSNPLYYARKYYVNNVLATELVIPDGVQSINAGVFADCDNLVSITIPESVISIGRGAFSGSLIAEIRFNAIAMDDFDHNSRPFGKGDGITLKIGAKVTKIPEYLCYYNTSIETLEFEEGSVCEILGAHAFSGCTALTSITIPESVTDIGYGVFAGCTSLEQIVFNAISAKDLEYNNRVFYEAGQNSNGIAVSIGERVIYIPRRLFEPFGNSSDNAFAANIISVKLGASVESVGTAAFSNCASITSVYIDDLAKWCGIIFASWDSNPLYWAENFYINDILMTDLVIPNGVESIGNYAFEGCTALVSITLPETLTSIGNLAFYSCESLTGVNIPNGVISIGQNAFAFCDSLTSITIPESVTDIGTYAFDSCTSLAAVYINSASVAFAMNFSVSCGNLCVYAQSVAVAKNIDNVGSYITSNFSCVEDISYDGVNYISYSRHTHIWQELETLQERVQCVQDGIVLYQCETCGVKKVVATTMHNLLHYEAKAPTCVEIGYYAYDVCENCSYTTRETIAALGHDYAAEWTVDEEATCIAAGSKSHHCSRCDSKTDVTVIEPLGHSYGEWQETVAPTCETKGEERRDCTACDAYETRELVAKGHSYTTAVTAPTCTTRGYTTYTCHCGDSYVENYVAVLGHDKEQYPAKAATCTESGWNAYETCTRCDYSTYEEIAALGHDYAAEWTVDEAATCTAAGSKSHHCSRCDSKTDVTVIEPLGHSYGEWQETVAPTCETKGEERRDCAACEAYETREVAAKGHSYTTAVTAPTCTTRGYTTYTCHCGDSYVVNYVAVLGQDKEQYPAKAATCTEIGWNAYETCTRCDYSTYAEIAALGHDYAAEWTVDVEATCITAGSKSHHCSRCDSKSDVTVIDALGHDKEHHAAKAATCTEIGWNAYETCTRCDYSTYAEIAALGHDYAAEWTVDVEATCTEAGSKSHHCSRCNAKSDVTVIDALGHNKAQHPAQSATCTEIGWEAYEACTRCDYTTYEEIPALGHRYNDANKCSVCGSDEPTFEKWDVSANSDGSVMAFLYAREDRYELVISGSGAMKDFASAAEVFWYSYRAKITRLDISQGVTNIGSYAFCSFTELTGVTIPEAVTSIGLSAFNNCTALTEINFNATAMDDLSKTNFVFAYAGQSGPGIAVIIGANVTKLPARLFAPYDKAYAPKIVSVIFEENSTCTSIGRDAFRHCVDLTSITIPESVTNIGSNAFGYCTNLTMVHIESEEIAAAIAGSGYCGSLVAYAQSVAISKDIGNVGAYLTNNFAYVEDISYDGVDYTLYSKHAHEWVELEILQERIPCEQVGIVLYQCSTCGAKNEVTTSSHSLVQQDSQSATCTQLGWKAYVVCTACGYNTYEEIAALGHNYGEAWTADVEATCTTAGSKSHHCSRCDSKSDVTVIDPLGHDKVQHSAQPATCIEIGWNAYETCTRCDYTTYVEIAALGHVKEQHAAKAATCTEIGWNAYETCTRCDYTTYVEIAALGHAKEQHAAKAGTCTEIGWSAYETCTRCDYSTYAEIEALGHDYAAEWTVDVEATCTEAGSKSHHCSRCDEKSDVTAIEPLGHSYGEWQETVAPTCETKGEERRDCTACDAYEAREVAAKGHSYTAVVTDPTCTARGYTTHTCHCGDSYVENYVAALGHDKEQHAAKAAICTEIGWNAYETCTRCDYSTYAEIAAIGHDYAAEWTVDVEATCTEAGSKSHHCSRCDSRSQITDIPAKGHEYTATVVLPTCVEQGYTVYTCHCGDYFTGDYVTAPGHMRSDWIIDQEPTCTEQGKKHKECTVCGYIVIELGISALGHHYAEEWYVELAATCTSDGVQYRTCTRCGPGVLLDRTVIPATGHSYLSVVTAPTCTARGYTTHTCHCGDWYEGDYVAALGHSIGDWVVTVTPSCTVQGEKAKACSVCQFVKERTSVPAKGHTRVVDVAVSPTCTTDGMTEGAHCDVCKEILVAQTIIPAAHQYIATITPSTCTEQGYTTHTCHCGEHYVDSYISALGHNYSNEWTVDFAATCTEAGAKSHHCLRCAEKTDETPINALDHARHTVPGKAPTCNEPGWETYDICIRCDYTTYRAISATGHTISDWITDQAAICTGTGHKHKECTVCHMVLENAVIAAIGHDYKSEVIAPTENEMGYTTKTCEHCGESFKTDYVAAKPDYNSTGSDSDAAKDKEQLPAGAVVAISVGGGVVLTSVASLLWFFIKKKRRV